MDQNDEELRESIKKLWPIQAKKMIPVLVPANEGRCIGSSVLSSPMWPPYALSAKHILSGWLL